MNQSQYEALEEQILDAFAALLHPVLRQEALRHTMRVIDMISLLHTDTPLWDRRTAALLHDTGKYLKNSPQHARTSAILCEQLRRKLDDKVELHYQPFGITGQDQGTQVTQVPEEDSSAKE